MCVYIYNGRGRYKIWTQFSRGCAAISCSQGTRIPGTGERESAIWMTLTRLLLLLRRHLIASTEVSSLCGQLLRGPQTAGRKGWPSQNKRRRRKKNSRDRSIQRRKKEESEVESRKNVEILLRLYMCTTSSIIGRVEQRWHSLLCLVCIYRAMADR